MDPEVRHGVVLALTGQERPRAIESLIVLTKDPEVHVRDWANLSRGDAGRGRDPLSFPREALVHRLADEDEDTRDEAIVGLARRRDRRMIRPSGADLASGSVGRLSVEAAATIGDPQPHPLLVALRGRWNVDVAALEEASGHARPARWARMILLDDDGSPLAPDDIAARRQGGKMNHGVVMFQGSERPELRIWEMAMGRGQFVALYTGRRMERSSDGSPWRALVVRAVPTSGEPPRFSRFPDLARNETEYARYEPAYDGEFLEMRHLCGRCSAVPTVVVPATARDAEVMRLGGEIVGLARRGDRRMIPALLRGSRLRLGRKTHSRGRRDDRRSATAPAPGRSSRSVEP